MGTFSLFIVSAFKFCPFAIFLFLRKMNWAEQVFQIKPSVFDCLEYLRKARCRIIYFTWVLRLKVGQCTLIFNCMHECIFLEVSLGVGGCQVKDHTEVSWEYSEQHTKFFLELFKIFFKSCNFSLSFVQYACFL